MTGHQILIGFPNRIDQASTITGGGWSAGLPLDNLKDRLFSRVARSVDADPANTQFVVDYGRPQRLRILAFVAHNMSLSSRLTIEAAEDEAFTTIFYSAEVDVWTGMLSAEWNIDELEWENDNFWTGTYTAEDIEGFTAVSTHILPGSISARYWRFKIEDPQNDAGYVQIGRLFMGPAWQPRINYSWGAGLGYEIGTGVETALGGAEFFNVKEPVRVFRFSLDHMRDDEGFGRALELVRRAGIHGEVFVVPDPTDAFQGLRRNFMGRIRQPSPLEQVTWANDGSAHSMSFEIKELR
ncbi:hypothetical protein [Aquamicrobium zhengzhouense]|uniref:Phage tail protein n=1 Tax=Aquamicrobium zhengzhouense TaxID=2781738 RepID=A0ABS0SDX6_9HYPH|nr:hypothetical protein [Aquamicrobium zhengzhouense]MBI1621508.1 hypothetical protein [Aquamicrobium zhengzhouense]